jgi:hypothetical protein
MHEGDRRAPRSKSPCNQNAGAEARRTVDAWLESPAALDAANDWRSRPKPATRQGLPAVAPDRPTADESSKRPADAKIAHATSCLGTTVGLAALVADSCPFTSWDPLLRSRLSVDQSAARSRRDLAKSGAGCANGGRCRRREQEKKKKGVVPMTCLVPGSRRQLSRIDAARPGTVFSFCPGESSLDFGPFSRSTITKSLPTITSSGFGSMGTTSALATHRVMPEANRLILLARQISLPIAIPGPKKPEILPRKQGNQ